MGNPASFVLTKKHVFWSKVSDDYEKIIEENESYLDGVRKPSIVHVKISPSNKDLSAPLDEWKYTSLDVQYPKWHTPESTERRSRKALREWAKCKLTGWRVYEAMHPINPFEIDRPPMPKDEVRELVMAWAKVQESVQHYTDRSWSPVALCVEASIRNFIGASVTDTIRDSVWKSAGWPIRNLVSPSIEERTWTSEDDSIHSSIRDTVWAYIGGLFPNIAEWYDVEPLGANPWCPLFTLWYSGRVPSFDGTTWRVHVGPEAKVEHEFTV